MSVRAPPSPGNARRPHLPGQEGNSPSHSPSARALPAVPPGVVACLGSASQLCPGPGPAALPSPACSGRQQAAARRERSSVRRLCGFRRPPSDKGCAIALLAFAWKPGISWGALSYASREARERNKWPGMCLPERHAPAPPPPAALKLLFLSRWRLLSASELVFRVESGSQHSVPCRRVLLTKVNFARVAARLKISMNLGGFHLRVPPARSNWD